MNEHGGSPRDGATEIEQAVAPLVGLPLRSATRLVDLLELRFGADDDGGYTLHIACPWRLADGERILVGSGDLFTPADPDEEPETFDWEQPGASWLDVRLGELWERFDGSPPAVRGIGVDPFGGLALALGSGMTLELFPASTPTGHIATEFWRLSQPGQGTPHVVFGTFGLERQES